MHKNCVAIRQDENVWYPQQVPFDPDECFPEWEEAHHQGEKNNVYRSVRQCFMDLGLDGENIGTARWSPLSDLVKPGNTVVIKPNLVLNTNDPAIQEYTTSHPSIVRVIADYVWKALRGEGQVIIGDAPGAEANFDEIIARNHLSDMVEMLRTRGMNISLKDFRAVRVRTENGVWIGQQRPNPDAPKSQIVNLGDDSLFACEKYKNSKLHGAGYDIKATTRHHRGTTQEYSVSQAILQADVVISVPKLKTHRKAGVTCCLKNLVGINTDKNYLPHFALGSANMGGDEMPAIDKKNIFKVKSYNWIREHVIAYTWKYIGGTAVKLLRSLKGQKEPAQPAPVPAEDGQPPVKKEKDVDLAKWFHNRLSGQQVAAGAWPGNDTICRMILDLNRIFLCCDRDGKLQEKTDRKIMYVVDAVGIGVGNGPTHPCPEKTHMIAAGFNGYQLDCALLGLLGVDVQNILLYTMASQYPWMLRDAEGAVLFNGRELYPTDRLSVKILPPEGWNY